MLKMFVLGSFDLEVEGVQVDTSTWTRRSSRQLLQLLVTRKNHKIRKEEVMDLLWPDLPFDACANRYYMAVHSLRSALEPERSGRGVSRFILSSGDFVSLNVPEQVCLDIDEFDLLANAIGKDSTDLAAYEKAIVLYRGPLFADDATEDWLTARREDLRVRYARLVQAYSELLLTAGQQERAIEALRRLVDLDLTNEEAHRKLMYAYGVAGHRVEALRQFDTLSRVLAEKVGVRADKQTEDLVQAIRRGELDARMQAVAVEPLAPQAAAPVQAAAAAAVDRFEPPYSSDTILARETDLQRISKLLVGQDVRLLNIYGLPGVGKSSVARQVAHLVQPHFANGVLWVDMDGAQTVEHVVANIFAAMLPLELPKTGNLPTVALALRGMELLLVLDHSDQVACINEVVTELLRRLPRLVVLMTARHALNSEFEYRYFLGPFAIPAWGSSLDPVALLKNDAVRFFIRQVKKTDTEFVLDEQTAPAVFDICRMLDGMPVALRYAASRLTVWSLQELHAKIKAPAVHVSYSGDLRIAKYPVLLEAVKESLQGLNQAAADDFLALSIVQGSFTLATAAAVCRRNDEEIEQSINALLGHGLLETRQTSNAPDTSESSRRGYYFLSVIREYAYEKLIASELADAACKAHALHFSQRMANASPELAVTAQRENTSVQRNAEAALGWACKAGHLNLAWPLFVAICEYRMTQGSCLQVEAFWHDMYKLVHAQADGSTSELGGLGVRIAQALFREGHVAQANVLLSLAMVKEAEATLQGVPRASAHLIRAQLLQNAGNHKAALALFELAHASLEQSDAHRGNAECKRLMAHSHGAMGEYDKAMRLAREALSLARWYAPVEEVFQAALAVAQHGLHLSRIDEVRAALSEAAALPVLPATKPLLAEVRMIEGFCLLHEGHPDQAKAIFEQTQSQYREDLSTVRSARSFMGLGICAALNKQYGYADVLLRQARDLLRASEDSGFSNQCLMLLSIVSLARGSYENLHGLLNDLVQEVSPDQSPAIVAIADVIAVFACNTGHTRLSKVLLRTGNMVRRRLGLVRPAYEAVLLQRGGMDMASMRIEAGTDSGEYGIFQQSGIGRLYRSVTHAIGLVSKKPERQFRMPLIESVVV